MKLATQNATNWIVNHAAPNVPISAKYVRKAAMNQAAFAKAIRGVEIDEHELFNELVIELSSLGRYISGLSNQELEEIFDSDRAAPAHDKELDEPFVTDISSKLGMTDEGIKPKDEKVKHNEPYVFKITPNMKFADFLESDFWGWLYDVACMAEAQGSDEIIFNASY